MNQVIKNVASYSTELIIGTIIVKVFIYLFIGSAVTYLREEEGIPLGSKELMIVTGIFMVPVTLYNLTIVIYQALAIFL